MRYEGLLRLVLLLFACFTEARVAFRSAHYVRIPGRKYAVAKPQLVNAAVGKGCNGYYKLMQQDCPMSI